MCNEKNALCLVGRAHLRPNNTKAIRSGTQAPWRRPHLCPITSSAMIRKILAATFLEGCRFGKRNTECTKASSEEVVLYIYLCTWALEMLPLTNNSQPLPRMAAPSVDSSPPSAHSCALSLRLLSLRSKHALGLK